jgi:ABC-type dipeptide/oligopeptide/nickel transport system ATPase component
MGGREPILTVRDLVTVFPATRGVVVAANYVSFDLRPGETMGLVGESGSGKSVTCRSLLRLVPEPGEIINGSVIYEGKDLLRLPPRELRSLRGREISMIFQDPLSSLNPVTPWATRSASPSESTDACAAARRRRRRCSSSTASAFHPHASASIPTRTSFREECANGS